MLTRYLNNMQSPNRCRRSRKNPNPFARVTRKSRKSRKTTRPRKGGSGNSEKSHITNAVRSGKKNKRLINNSVGIF